MLSTKSGSYRITNSFSPLTDAWLRNRVCRVLEGFQTGSLVVVWPDAMQSTYGSPCSPENLDGYGTRENPIVVTLHNYRPIHGLAIKGSMGWAESYMDGDWTCNNLKALFLLFLTNEDRFPTAIHGSIFKRMANKVVHRWNRNTLSGSKRNIARHYDLGNDFYSLWLDKSMSYSSAWFDSREQSLAQAQQGKMRKIVEAVGAESSDRVLEIGCGWGSMARTLATESRCSVTGISLSREQLVYARRNSAGGNPLVNPVGDWCSTPLRGTINFEYCDYRNVRGKFDHIVSIEMFEAVGREYWSDYFTKLHATLNRGGTAVLQVITILEDRFDSYVNKPDFIQRYIFPGGMLPTKTALAGLAESHGFSIDSADYFGDSYATTLRLWREQFEKSLTETRAQGFDESFIRMWRYYLAYCEAGFSRGSTDVGMWRLVKR